MKILPHYSEIAILKAKGARSSSYARSVWYGFTQGPLNLPRQVITSIYYGVKIIAVGLFLGLLYFLEKGVAKPFFGVFGLMVLGLLGRLTLLEDEEAKGTEISRLGGDPEGADEPR